MDRFADWTCRAPEVSQDFVYQMSVHLHRYLVPWLSGPDRPEALWVAVGFARTDAEALYYKVDAKGADRIDVDWAFDDLVDRATGQSDGGPLAAPEPGATRLMLLRLDDGASRIGRVPDGPLGFVMASADSGLSGKAIEEVCGRASEAIRAARRNSVRLLLEATSRRRDLTIKEEIYAVLHHLPEWLGVDHSATLMITHDAIDMVRLGEGVEALTRAPTYDAMAERLFFDAEDAPPRLVGLRVPATEAHGSGSGLLACALRRQAEEPERRFHRFVPLRRASKPGEPALWTAIDASGEHVQGMRLSSPRPTEGRAILVPLISASTDGVAPELLGWLRLGWRRAAALPASTGAVLGMVSDALATRLRRSSLFTLSARQLLLLENLRDALHAVMKMPRGGEDPRDVFLGLVVAHIAARTGLPSIALGRVIEEAGGRKLWFAHQHGWTESQSLSLDIDDPDTSGVVGLSVRLGQPVVLAGGSDDEAQKAWKNTTWVNEGQGRLQDERHLDPTTLEEPGWRRLSSYYRSAHAGTYATLAWPIGFGDDTLGVIAVEVTRRTTWLWWSGIGSQIFWRLLAAELAMALKLLGNAPEK